MGEIVGLVSKSERERIRLIREARAIYDSIFPPTDAVSERPDNRPDTFEVAGHQVPAPLKGNVGMIRHS